MSREKNIYKVLLTSMTVVNKNCFSFNTIEKNQFIVVHKNLSFIHMVTAFCRVQSYPPDDLRWVYVMVMRSDESTSPDEGLHATRLHDSSNAADTDL